MNAEAIRSAARDAEQRRANIDRTIVELQRRLAPQQLARQATDAVRTRSSALAGGARDAAERRPGVAAAGAGVVFLLLAWKPASALLRRLKARRARRDDLVTATPIAREEDAPAYQAALSSPLVKVADEPLVTTGLAH